MNNLKSKWQRNNNNFSGQGQYEIKVKGHIEARWSDWFEGMKITAGFEDDNGPITTFTGAIRDQTALHGILAKIRDINMPLLSVNKIKKSEQ